jgi:SET domain-containing protein
MRQAVAAENESALEESLHDHKFEDVKPIRKRLASKIDTNVNENMPFKLVQYPNSIKLKVAKVLVPSTQKNGVFAMETVEPNKTVVEFTGEILRLDAAYTRELRYEEMGIASNMFKFDEEYVSSFKSSSNIAFA